MPQDSLKSLVQEHTPVHVCQFPLKPHLPSLQLSALSIFKCLQFPKNIIFFHTLTSALPCTASLLGTLLSSQLNCDFPTASSVPSDLSHADLYLGVPLQFVDLCVSLLTSKTTWSGLFQLCISVFLGARSPRVCCWSLQSPISTVPRAQD